MTDEPSEAREPCPWCENDQTVSHKLHGRHWVECMACEARGPVEFSEEKAWVAWGDRAAARNEGRAQPAEEDEAEYADVFVEPEMMARARARAMAALEHAASGQGDRVAVADAVLRMVDPKPRDPSSAYEAQRDGWNAALREVAARVRNGEIAPSPNVALWEALEKIAAGNSIIDGAPSPAFAWGFGVGARWAADIARAALSASPAGGGEP